MRMNFSTHVMNVFENDATKVQQFNQLMLDASRNTLVGCTQREASDAIRAKFNEILGVDKNSSPKERRQAWRAHKVEIYEIIEDVLEDKLVSGWTQDNAFFEQFVDQRNLALGDTNEFYVEDNSMLTVSQFAGNHHNLLRQKMSAGKSYRIETSWYGLKVYTDLELYLAGRIDWAALVNKIYTSVDKFRKDAMYAALMGADEYLPTDLVLDENLTASTKQDLIDLAEEVRAATGKDVAIFGTKAALSKVANLVPYDVWSDTMKDKYNQTGELGMFEGIQLVTIPRVNELNTRTEITDNTKLLILPIDPEFKPIKWVSEGESIFNEYGADGSKMDRTIEAEYSYKEGIAVVINQLYGVFKIKN